ncbi:hypothetical protein BN2156_02574 [Mycolicibacterium neworleansense]|uniref:Uncharacterized protein n=1 Tax=Mycolicibacterium neworleansense TaxID=146018 RepID=A0A0H5RPG8_9MYCO|nr:hypothetical protein BN2156_02574 [Mycolicibacterium neworleansense]
MAGPALSVPLGGGLEIMFERIADAIEAQQRRALAEYAVTEVVWHAAPASAGCSRHAA